MAKRNGKRVMLDFDGVLHSYLSGYDPVPSDPPVEGAQGFCRWLIVMGFRPVVFTTRGDTEEGRAAVKAYLAEHGFPEMPVTNLKFKAMIYVDDRGYRFTGDFSDLKTLIKMGAESWIG